MNRKERKELCESLQKIPVRHYAQVQTTPLKGSTCSLCKSEWRADHSCSYGCSEGVEVKDKGPGGDPIRIAMAGDRFIRAVLVGYQEGLRVVEHRDGSLEVLHDQVETF